MLDTRKLRRARHFALSVERFAWSVQRGAFSVERGAWSVERFERRVRRIGAADKRARVQEAVNEVNWYA
jgi:hypothetical protein